MTRPTRIDDTGLPDWLGYLVVLLAVGGVVLTEPWAAVVVIAFIVLMAGGN